MSQLRHWNLSKVQCTLLTAEKASNIYDSELEQLKIPIEVLLPDSEASPILRTAKSIGSFKKYIYAHSCDIIYLNLANAVAMECARIARRAGIPRVIVHSHCAGIRPGRGHVFKMLAHQIMKKRNAKYATDWWACSEQAACFLFTKKELPKVKYIPNGIDAERYRFDEQMRVRTRKELGIKDEETKIIGTVGRCSSEKNQKFLLDVFIRVNQKHPNTKLLIVGDGPLLPELQQYAQRVGIDEDCIFYGYTMEVFPLYCAMDIFCLPSTIESFGIAALEAQAAGCKCILSEHVPSSICVGEYTEVAPLDNTDWASRVETVIKTQCDKKKRKDTYKIIYEHGFDIASIAKTVNMFLFFPE